ncbi:MAG: DUF882 domain-containing protein [Gammaproteobacteria bacterium]|nr:DUF882 domain-containing protein [Gammaproteobacteria bacterium]
MSLKRRDFLRLGGAAVAAAAGLGAVPRPARAAMLQSAMPVPPSAEPSSDPGAEPKRIAFANLHTGEELDVTFFRDRTYVPTAMNSIENLLRDFRNDERHPIDPRLMDYLHAVALRFGADPRFEVISGYRSPQTNAMLRATTRGVALHSFHMKGRAIDIRLPQVDCARLAEAALALRRGGVGYYRASNFVHLDTGAFRTWHG